MNKWAVVGKGFIYPRHEAAIKSVGDELLMTCDPDKKKGADFLEWKEMLQDKRFKDEVTHVAICTPNYLHRPMILEAVDAGKTVLCEKPVVLESWQLEEMPDNVYTMLQLRHHPLLIRPDKRKMYGMGEMIITVNRDKSYWSGWKGDEVRSGGILFNLGVHYFDALIQLFGDEYEIVSSHYEDGSASGIIKFKKAHITYDMVINERGDQERTIRIGGMNFNFSNRDNLSYEDLHVKVYEDVQKGKGVKPKDAMRSIKLIEDLKAYANRM